MKKNSKLFVLLFLSGVFIFVSYNSVFAQATIPSQITDVVVYQRGAKITNQATVLLQAGNNEIVLDDITTSINANSLQVKIAGGAILLSANARVRTLDDKDIPKQTKFLEDTIRQIDKELNWLESQRKVFEGEEKIIYANQKLGTEEEKVTVEEIIQLTTFYRDRLLDIKARIYKIDNAVYQLNLTKTILQNKLNELRYTEQKSVGEIVLNISAEKATSVKVRVSYLSFQAGWQPVYDVRAKGADEPVKLLYKANVYQTTGIKWDKVNLTISTGNPTANNDRPMMYPWYLEFQVPIVYQGYASMEKKVSEQNMYQRSMAMEDMEVADDEFGLAEVAEIGYEVAETTNRIAAEYAIDALQDIPSDENLHLVAMKEYDLNSKYTYHSIPKLDKAAFLLAKIADYGAYNLLPGEANIFYEDMYIGQSYLNPATTVDSMLLSLGRDDKITVARNQLKDFSARQVVGGNVKETKTYEITVRNNNSFEVEMDLLDQVPISKEKEIEVKVEDAGGAKFDLDFGSLLWKFMLKAGESKKVRFTYSVKYPGDKVLTGY